MVLGDGYSLPDDFAVVVGGVGLGVVVAGVVVAGVVVAGDVVAGGVVVTAEVVVVVADDPLPPPLALMWKGNEYWKTDESESSVIWMP